MIEILEGYTGRLELQKGFWVDFHINERGRGKVTLYFKNSISEIDAVELSTDQALILRSHLGVFQEILNRF